MYLGAGRGGEWLCQDILKSPPHPVVLLLWHGPFTQKSAGEQALAADSSGSSSFLTSSIICPKSQVNWQEKQQFAQRPRRSCSRVSCHNCFSWPLLLACPSRRVSVATCYTCDFQGIMFFSFMAIEKSFEHKRAATHMICGLLQNCKIMNINFQGKSC